MKTRIPYFLLAAAAAASLLSLPASSSGQAAGDDPVILSLISEVITQQTAILENQAKIDDKIATIAEDVRQARLFAARGGKAK